MPSGKPNHWSKEWILNLPKVISENGCWIPTELKPDDYGYIPVKIEGKLFKLHRVVLCLYYDIPYNDLNIITRHSMGCSKSCFNPEHLKPGTYSENAKDSIREGTHHHSNKECCPKCGGPYRTVRFRKPAANGQIFYRYCVVCKNNRRRERYHEK